MVMTVAVTEKLENSKTTTKARHLLGVKTNNCLKVSG